MTLTSELIKLCWYKAQTSKSSILTEFFVLSETVTSKLHYNKLWSKHIQ